MTSYINAAFHNICSEAEAPRGVFVSLYVRVPFYGGPEEGGWWGHDVRLEASQAFSHQDQADEAKAKIERLAEDLNKQARHDFGKQCAYELDWLEARGLDPDYLPEPDGECRYFVIIEEQRGSNEYEGERYYS